MQLSLFKKCTLCGETKLFTQFSVKNSSGSGRSARCKACCNAVLREYNQTPESVQARKEKRIVRRANPEEVEKDRARDRDRWNEKRKQQHNDALRELYATPEGKTRHTLRAQKFAATDKGRTYRQVRVINRRALLRGESSSFTREEWIALCERYEFKCLCCGNTFPLKKLSADHIVPVTRGGANDIHNIQPLCIPCNSKKGTQTIDYLPAWE
jgi:5-methylcytosine-specific restriction endonuclease McrA